ncbi:peptidase S9 [Trueperella bialowiezensis]|uniref:Uncharacterized protein n=1 Tax=Trueperella bialowiezensis TaxID=312285 RepID=A0A3S4X699_9ACTO|nr:peptidase S9 [Trueperella bialowiezensis]VEI13572.1 Uncharacterised protein [Trueperella bialowiezensis]
MPSKEQAIAHYIAQMINTTAYYALPDVVRSTALRRTLRLGLGGIMAYNEFNYQLTQGNVDLNVNDLIDDDDDDAGAETASEGMNPLGMAVIGGVVAGGIALVVGVERAIFKRGERKRAEGDRFAHLKQGLMGGALTVLSSVAIDYFDNLPNNHETADVDEEAASADA